MQVKSLVLAGCALALAAGLWGRTKPVQRHVEQATQPTRAAPEPGAPAEPVPPALARDTEERTEASERPAPPSPGEPALERRHPGAAAAERMESALTPAEADESADSFARVSGE